MRRVLSCSTQTQTRQGSSDRKTSSLAAGNASVIFEVEQVFVVSASLGRRHGSVSAMLYGMIGRSAKLGADRYVDGSWSFLNFF